MIDFIEAVVEDGVPGDDSLDTMVMNTYAAIAKRYAYIHKSCFSPDGRYALLLVGSQEELHLIALRLSDMSTREVRGDAAEILSSYGDLSYVSLKWYDGSDSAYVIAMNARESGTCLWKWEY